MSQTRKGIWDYMLCRESSDPLDSIYRKFADLHLKYSKDEWLVPSMGFADTMVKQQLWKAQAMDKAAIYDQFYTYLSWFCPVLCNAACLPCVDLTHLEEKMKTGLAQQITCGCFPCGGIPEEPSLPFAWGRDDELIIIASCPGDHHSYRTPGQDERTFDEAMANKYIKELIAARKSLGINNEFPHTCNESCPKPEKERCPKTASHLHTMFQRIADASDGHVIHAPVMMLNKQVRESEFYKDTNVAYDPRADVVSSSDNYNPQLWLGYWTANVREALSQAKNLYWAKKIKVVAVYGGGPASKNERATLQNLGVNGATRASAKEEMLCMFNSGMCCVTCGGYYCAKACCHGLNSGIYMAEGVVLRMMLCADPREVPVEFMTVDAAQLVSYLSRSDLTDGDSALVNKKQLQEELDKLRTKQAEYANKIADKCASLPTRTPSEAARLETYFTAAREARLPNAPGDVKRKAENAKLGMHESLRSDSNVEMFVVGNESIREVSKKLTKYAGVPWNVGIGSGARVTPGDGSGPANAGKRLEGIKEKLEQLSADQTVCCALCVSPNSGDAFRAPDAPMVQLVESRVATGGRQVDQVPSPAGAVTKVSDF